MKKRTILLIKKYALYILTMFLLYILQTVPQVWTIFSIKPDLVAVAALSIAFLEGELSGGIFGAIAGILCDYGAISLFGFHAMSLLVLCAAAGLLSLYYFRSTMINLCILILAALLLRSMLDFLLHYLVWGYDNVYFVLLQKLLPTVLYSTICAVPVYYLYRRLHHRFREVLES